MKTHEKVLLPIFVLSLTLALLGDKLPVLTPVESPFPAEEAWLGVYVDSSEGTGADSAANAATIRHWPSLNRRVLYHERRPEVEPWASAYSWAEERAGGEPYYMIRQGHKAAEGSLSGSVSAMSEKLIQELEATN